MVLFCHIQLFHFSSVCFFFFILIYYSVILYSGTDIAIAIFHRTYQNVSASFWISSFLSELQKKYKINNDGKR